jgi:hypothetical protein
MDTGTVAMQNRPVKETTQESLRQSPSMIHGVMFLFGAWILLTCALEKDSSPPQKKEDDDSRSIFSSMYNKCVKSYNDFAQDLALLAAIFCLGEI